MSTSVHDIGSDEYLRTIDCGLLEWIVELNLEIARGIA